MDLPSDDKTNVVHQQVLAGRYRVDGRLGEGGMGSVLMCLDLTTKQHVAVKMLGLDLVDKPEFVTRFDREARLLAKLNHPGLVPLIAVDSHEGAPFIVMKLIEGQTLDRLIKERKRLSVRQALPLVQQLASALDFLHARGVVHRDLKPANIMVDANDHLTLVDFGISQQKNTTRLTLPGLVLGTPLYMAPEQILTDEAGPSADIYALALLTWVMLVGEHPFAREERRESMFTRQVMEVPAFADALNPAVPAPVAQVLQRSLEKDPALRHPTAMDFYGDLARSNGFDSTTSEPDLPRSVSGDTAPSVGQGATVVFTRDQTVVDPPQPAGPTTAMVLAVVGVAVVLAALLVWILK